MNASGHISTVATTSSREFQLQPVWPSPSAQVQEEVVRFWLAESALPNRAIAEQRAPQLLVVARDVKGDIVGVSTAARNFVPLLGFECFYYRTFIGSRCRHMFLSGMHPVIRILKASFELLNRRFEAGRDRNVLGLFAEIDNPSLMRTCNRAVWQEYGIHFVYIGRTVEGRHLRVWYFEGARVP